MGTVLASIDVAIEQKTGQDIANHAITFFATNNGANHNDGHRASNVADNTIRANLNNAEYTGTAYGVDILSNGFKLKNS